MANIVTKEVSDAIINNAGYAGTVLREVEEKVMGGQDEQAVPILDYLHSRCEQNAKDAEVAAVLMETLPRVSRRRTRPNLSEETVQAIDVTVARMKAKALVLDASASHSEVTADFGRGGVQTEVFKLTSDKCDLVPFGSGYLVMGGTNKDVPLAGFNDLKTAISVIFGNSQMVRPSALPQAAHR